VEDDQWREWNNLCSRMPRVSPRHGMTGSKIEAQAYGENMLVREMSMRTGRGTEERGHSSLELLEMIYQEIRL
jgi:hypothetical protein